MKLYGPTDSICKEVQGEIYWSIDIVNIEWSGNALHHPRVTTYPYMLHKKKALVQFT